MGGEAFNCAYIKVYLEGYYRRKGHGYQWSRDYLSWCGVRRGEYVGESHVQELRLSLEDFGFCIFVGLLVALFVSNIFSFSLGGGVTARDMIYDGRAGYKGVFWIICN